MMRILLAGNPNCGKTSIFNQLTGARHKVANYPGVTVEKRAGTFVHRGRRFELFDLPGTYSLTSYSPEERVACGEMQSDDVAVTVVVVESTLLSRSLHLLAQVMQIHANPVLCLNMWDEFEASGASLDLAQLRSLLGFPVVTTVGHLGKGIEELKEVILEAADNPVRRNGRLVLGERLERALAGVAQRLEATPVPLAARAWTAEKLLVEDPEYTDHVAAHGEAGSAAVEEAARARKRLEAETGLDMPLYVTERYHGFVDGLLREVLRRPPRADARAVSDRIDRVLVHRVLGLPIFLLIMYGLFWATFRLGETPMGWIESGFDHLGTIVSGFWPAGSASPLRSLLVDGVIAGVGGVLVFVPNILLLFLGLAALEDTGYMARAAFLMDRYLHPFGLHGQSFIPLMSGFGCSIPGIMATRTLRNERDRLTTILVLPLMSCGARLTIWMLLVPAFFAPSRRAPALLGIYLAGVILALLVALVVRKAWLKGKASPFVLELPPYRTPTARALFLQIFDRCGMYVRKAGTIILAVSVLMWAIASYPKPASYAIDRDLATGTVVVGDPAGQPELPGVRVLTESEVAAARASEDLRASITGTLGRALEPVIKPMGFDWRVGSGLIGAFAAKEVFVAQMGIVYALGGENDDAASLRSALRASYPPAAGLALMVFLLVATPCMATVAITRRETGGWKWAAVQFWGLTALGYLLAVGVYQIGRLL